MPVLEGSGVEFEVLYGLSVAVEAPRGRFVGLLGHHEAILEASCFSGRAYVSERCDCNLCRLLGCLFPELRLKAFGEHEGDNDRSEDFDLVSLTVLERPSLISCWGRPTSRAAMNIESGFEGFSTAE